MIRRRDGSGYQRALVRSADIVGQHEIVQRTGASKGAVSMWLTRSPANGFPAPVLALGCGRLFLWSEVEAWHLARQKHADGSLLRALARQAPKQ